MKDYILIWNEDDEITICHKSQFVRKYFILGIEYDVSVILSGKFGNRLELLTAAEMGLRVFE